MDHIIWKRKGVSYKLSTIIYSPLYGYCCKYKGYKSWFHWVWKIGHSRISHYSVVFEIWFEETIHASLCLHLHWAPSCYEGPFAHPETTNRNYKTENEFNVGELSLGVQEKWLKHSVHLVDFQIIKLTSKDLTKDLYTKYKPKICLILSIKLQ